MENDPHWARADVLGRSLIMPQTLDALPHETRIEEFTRRG
jgi:hypothetical protein